MPKIASIFLRGIAVLLPAALTLYLLWALGAFAERMMRAVIILGLPERYYVPGMGLAAFLALLFGVGLLAGFWPGRALVNLLHKIMESLPLVKTIYGAVKDFTDYFSSPKQKENFNQTVMVEWPEAELRMVGFVTKEDLSALDGEDREEEVAVYLPMSYQVGGYMVLLPRKRLKSLDLGFEEALRFIFTSGVSTGRGHAS